MLPKIKIKNRTIHLSIREERAILLVCMGIALVFWILVKLSQFYFTEKEVHFQVLIPDEKTFSTMPPDDFIAQIEGTGWELMFEYFRNAKVLLSYDLRELDRLSLNIGQLRSDILHNLSSNNIKIQEINYTNINLALEPKLSKVVPIHLSYALSFKPEYNLQPPIQLSPDSITVTGPISIVEHIQQWETDSLVMDELKTRVEIPVKLAKPARELNLSHLQTSVEIEVEQFTERSLFVPITILNATDSVKIFPEKIKLSCVVGLSQFNAFDQDDFCLEVDLKNIPSNRDRNTAPIVLKGAPEFVKNIKFSPKSAEFFILR